MTHNDTHSRNPLILLMFLWVIQNILGGVYIKTMCVNVSYEKTMTHNDPQ